MDIRHIEYIDHFWRECDPRFSLEVNTPAVQEIFGEKIGEIKLLGKEFVIIRSERVKNAGEEHRVHYIIKDDIIRNDKYKIEV